jgi:hypothetical protein
VERLCGVLDQDPPSSIDEIGEKDKSTTSRPISSVQKNHLAPVTSVVADNNERLRHTKKLISPDLKNSEKGKLSI